MPSGAPLAGDDNGPMSDESQIEIPPAFIALYVEPGRSKPSLGREQIAARYGFCEDLATMLTDTARSRLWELGIAEADVLERIHLGLVGGETGLNPSEAWWVSGRLAELLEWELPASITDTSRPTPRSAGR